MGRSRQCEKQPKKKNAKKLWKKKSGSSSASMGNLLNIRARNARSQMRNGIKLYQQQNPQQAIRQWRQAVRKLKSVEDKFITSGYIVQAFCDSGEFEQMLYAAVEQVELANGHQDDFMKSEALLNLARANERLGEFEKAIGYAEGSLALPGIDGRSPGYAHLVVAMAHMGLSNFQPSLQQFEKAMKIANAAADKLLELQICVGLAQLFTQMRDLDKALIFLQNALGILQGIEANHVHAKYKSAILYQLSVILRRNRRYPEAREVCEESLELAKKVGNKPIFARSLASLADICREVGETEARETITKSWARYEQAFRLLRKLNDRMGQIVVLSSMAKSAAENKGVHYAGRCECQAIQLNRKCLEAATLVGCKHAQMECHLRLQELYRQLEDDENSEASSRAQRALVQEMELFCNFCGQRYGEADESLQALACSHIFHERCLQKFFVRIGDTNPTTCPKCRTRTSLMETVSISSSNAQTPAGESIADFLCAPSTSTASHPSFPLVPTVLCERNFDDNRWTSPCPAIATSMESAERQICLSTSTSAIAMNVAVPWRKGPNGTTTATGDLQQQAMVTLSTFGQHSKENAVGAAPNRLGEEEMNDVQSLAVAVEEGSEATGSRTAFAQSVQNHVESGSGGSRREQQTKGRRLLAMGREKMAAISPVAEEAEEEEDWSRTEERLISLGKRGVTEL